MKTPLQVQCPHCHVQLRLNHRDSLGRRFRCRGCRKVFVAEEVVEDFDSADNDWPSPAAPRSAAETETESEIEAYEPARVRRPIRIQRRWVVAGVCALVLIGALFVIPWKSVSRTVSNLNPQADTPHSVLSALEDLSVDYTAQVKSVQEGEPADKATPAAEELGRRVEDLYLRAARFRQMTSEEKKELFGQHPKCAQFLLTDLFGFGQEWMNRFKKTREESYWGIRMSYVHDIAMNVALEIKDMEILPEPKDSIDRIELAMIDVIFNANDSLLDVDSAGEMESAAARLLERAKELRKLADQLDEERSASGGTRGHRASPFEKFRDSLDHRMRRVAWILVEHYGQNKSLIAAVESLQDADCLIAKQSFEESLQNRKFDDPFSDMNIDSNGNLAAYVRQHGKKNVLFIGETREIEGRDRDTFKAGLKNALGKDPDGTYEHGRNCNTYVCVTDKDPNEVAAKISGTKVLSVSSERRQILVEPFRQEARPRFGVRSIEPELARLEQNRGPLQGPLERDERAILNRVLSPMPPDLRANHLLPITREQAIKEMTDKYGKENVVVVVIPETNLTGKQQGELFDRMQAIAGHISIQRFAYIDHREGTVLMSKISGDVKELAAAMAFAKVRSVDVENRTITVEPFAANWGTEPSDASKSNDKQHESKPHLEAVPHPQAGLEGEQKAEPVPVALKTREEAIKDARESWGAKNLVVILMPDTYLDGAGQDKLVNRMKAISGSGSHTFHIDQTQKEGTALVSKIPGDVKELAASMVFAKVRSVDEKNRVITLEPFEKKPGQPEKSPAKAR